MAGPDLTTIAGPWGRFTVGKPWGERFSGMLDQLHADYPIKPGQSGGYNARFIAGTHTPSEHAFGRAIDVNWSDNPRGGSGTIPADLARSSAAAWGMKWGGDWRSPDPMHFEVDPRWQGPMPGRQPAPDRMEGGMWEVSGDGAFDALGNPTRRGLLWGIGEPKPTGILPSSDAAAPTQPPPAQTEPPAQRPGFLGGLAQRLNAPLTQQGIGLLLAASEGKDLNEGMSAGAARARQAQEAAHRDWEMRRQIAQQDAVRRLMADPAMAQNAHPVAVGLAKAGDPSMLMQMAVRHPELELERQRMKLATQEAERKFEQSQALMPEELAQSRLKTRAMQRELDSPAGKVTVLPDGASAIVTDPRTGESRVVQAPEGGVPKEFRKESAKQIADLYKDYMSDGQKARLADSDLLRMQQLSDAIGSGKFAQWLPTVGPWATSLGINLKGLPEAEAFQAIVSKMAPQMRPTGSGATSDRDMAIFMNSLPQLAQTPQGRQLVMEQMRAMNTYSRERARIASAVMNGRMPPADGEAAIAALPEPLAAFKTSTEAARPAGGTIPSGHVRYLQQNARDPRVVRDFEAKYGAGSAKQFLEQR